MCDYSLLNIKNRLGVEGEQLVVHRFRTGSVGLTDLASVHTAPADACAVCVPPGARLLLADIPESIQQQLRVGPEEEVRFTQLTADAYAYRDAVRFKNGAHVLVQRLKPGQRVRVLDLSLAEERPAFARSVSLERVG